MLNRTILSTADLLLADLQGASLLQANLQFANLLGTKFGNADLQGANLEEATGLLGSQLAGANLRGAVLPAQLATFAGLEHVHALARRTGWLILSMLSLNALVWLRIFTTTDVRLLQNSPSLPFAGFQTVLPLVPFYLFAPIVMLGLYVCFHLYLQRLWDRVAALPAIFPDGRCLHTSLPWFARWPARRHMRWVEEHNPLQSGLETGVSIFLMYWVVPITTGLFWVRYLTLQDLRGTTLHVLLLVAAIAAAASFPGMAAAAFAPAASWPAHPASELAVEKGSLRRALLLFGTAAVFFLASAGVILGAPYGDPRPLESKRWAISSAATHALWLIGYNPYAQLIESDLSTKPANWTGREEEMALVKGANLNEMRLRHVQAYGAFLVKARLWRADLQSAYLSEADLREANLHQAVLQSATIDRARLNRAILQGANLREADATRADLRDADLSRASLFGTILTDAKLDGAILYGADLRNALLQRASLQKADLREAQLGGTDLASANLQEAYLSSARMAGASLQRAHLVRAILIEADLRNADLREANLQGAVMKAADLAGANLQRADLRGAMGLNAAQLCLAGNLRQTQLDENIEQGVETQCAELRWSAYFQ